MQFGIRRAAAADATALAELAAITFPLACPAGCPADVVAAFTQAHLAPANFAAYLADPLRVIFVAEEQQIPGEQAAAEVRETAEPARLLGYSMLVDAPPSAADVAAVVTEAGAIEFSKCYAHPDTHGSGVAAGIMAASLDWIAGHGRNLTWLGVNSENVRAQRFYRKHGFAVAGTRSFQLGTRIEHDYVMVRSK